MLCGGALAGVGARTGRRGFGGGRACIDCSGREIRRNKQAAQAA